jgi:hypothetical protein
MLCSTTTGMDNQVKNGRACRIKMKGGIIIMIQNIIKDKPVKPFIGMNKE